MIRVEGLYKKYAEEYLYENFNIAFEENKITTLIGPSGCGKTTLIRILAGLEPYEKGRIEGLEGKNIAFIFQEDRLIPWLSVYENINFILKAKVEEEKIYREIKNILEMLKIWEYKDYKPKELSGGMKRRVAIARALVYPSEVLLMDEPFKGLDQALKEEILIAFKKTWEVYPKTVIFITHQLEEAEKIADYTLRIENIRAKK